LWKTEVYDIVDSYFPKKLSLVVVLGGGRRTMLQRSVTTASEFLLCFKGP